MGRGKKEASRRERTGEAGNGIPKVKGENFYRTAKKARALKIFNEGKPERNAQGKITKAAPFQAWDIPTAVVEPNRKWFQNSRVISTESLNAFRNAIAEQTKDPYQVLLKTNKVSPQLQLAPWPMLVLTPCPSCP